MSNQSGSPSRGPFNHLPAYAVLPVDSNLGDSLLTFLIAVVGGAPQGSLAPPPPPSATQTRATRAIRPPVIDGRDDDEVWKTAQPITDFREFDPDEGKPARFPTVAKVAYDEHNFYVFIRAFDPEPQKILKILARRDVRPPTDQLKIVIDSYHDRRTGYEFAVSPGGVKRDYAIYNDGNEDDSWDGVWDVATTVDSLGWTAEFRIPLSQLRYANAPTHTFGFAVWRDIERYKERVSWPLYHRQQAGFASQLGEVTGIEGISSPRRLEATPYLVTKNISVPATVGFDHDQRFTRRRLQVRRDLQPHARRHGQSGLRTGGGRPLGTQPHRIRDVFPGEAAVLHRGREPAELRRQLQHRQLFR